MSSRTSVFSVVLATALLLSGASATAAAPGSQNDADAKDGLAFISRTADGDASDSGGAQYLERVSASGQLVVFESNSSDMVPGDTNGWFDIFLRDRTAGTTTLISRGVGGTPGNGDSNTPDISGDGRFISYHSAASNLVKGDTNDALDIFVYDVLSGKTTLASLALGGRPADGGSGGARISDDGRFVSFVSEASNLVTTETDGVAQVFLRDRRLGKTVLVTHRPDGTAADEATIPMRPTVSGNGKYVGFDSDGTDLVEGDTNDDADVFVYDRKTDTNSLVSLGSGGAPADGGSVYAEVSAQGRFVVFQSSATNLTRDDTEVGVDVFRFDRKTGTNMLISRTPGGKSADCDSTNPTISPNGRFVAFQSCSRHIVHGLPPGGLVKLRIFDADTSTREVRLASHYADGSASDGTCLNAELPANGRLVFFACDDPLMPVDKNTHTDVYAARVF